MTFTSFARWDFVYVRNNMEHKTVNIIIVIYYLYFNTNFFFFLNLLLRLKITEHVILCEGKNKK